MTEVTKIIFWIFFLWIFHISTSFFFFIIYIFFNQKFITPQFFGLWTNFFGLKLVLKWPNTMRVAWIAHTNSIFLLLTIFYLFCKSRFFRCFRNKFSMILYNLEHLNVHGTTSNQRQKLSLILGYTKIWT